MKLEPEVRARLEEIESWVERNIIHSKDGFPVLMMPYELLDKLSGLKQMLGSGGGKE